MEVFVAGLGVLGAGLEGWPETRAILTGQKPWRKQDLVLQAPEILSGRERRRSTETTRLALNAAQEAVTHAGHAATELAAVFGSANGSGLETHLILKALTEPDMPVSPTLFHNSVHNSAVGYWCIATGCHRPSTSIACHDATFPAALLKAAAQAKTEETGVLLTVSDCPLPAPLSGKRPLEGPFAVAMVLTPAQESRSRFRMTASWQTAAAGNDVTGLREPGDLAAFWLGNPAARALPLLQAFALGGDARVIIDYPEAGRLLLQVAPC
jgi:hypothetical protein